MLRISNIPILILAIKQKILEDLNNKLEDPSGSCLDLEYCHISCYDLQYSCKDCLESFKFLPIYFMLFYILSNIFIFLYNSSQIFNKLTKNFLVLSKSSTIFQDHLGCCKGNSSILLKIFKDFFKNSLSSVSTLF